MYTILKYYFRDLFSKPRLQKYEDVSEMLGRLRLQAFPTHQMARAQKNENYTVDLLSLAMIDIADSVHSMYKFVCPSY
jgi:hypothetical protein